MRFENQIVIVTGGGNGIGRATALRFSREGARVVVADIDAENARRVAQEIRDGGSRALDIPVDVTSRESVAAMMAETVATFGQVDVLCAIAGIAGEVAFVDMTDAEW